MSRTYVGARLRRLRTERGMSQVVLARRLEISASYLNQIEHDVRPLSVPVLTRITEVFGVDTTFFDSLDGTRLVAELREVALDRDVGFTADVEELADMVAAHPSLARAMVNMHRRYSHTTSQLATATEHRYSDGTGDGTISEPHEDVRDYFYQRQNYLDELDTAAEALATKLRLHRGDAAGEISKRLRNLYDVQVVDRFDMGENVLHRFDARTRLLEISPNLSSGQRLFRFAAELAYLECGDLIRRMVDEGGFTGEQSRSLAALGFANYFAAATVLPYAQIHAAAEEFRYDIERLSAFYSVSYETVCHRLSTLQRPSLRGVPFSFVRVDRAGNMSKRQSATGFHFSSTGGTCPLWNVYETFSSPGRIMTQIAEMPDGRRYLWIARTVERRAARYGEPGKSFAIGMGCEVREASRVVYADSLDFGGTAATPIGAGCRVCERVNCAQRAFPPVGRELDINEHRSSVSPYVLRPPASR